MTAPTLAVDVGDAANAVGAAPVALITGSDRGLGFALTQELVARGWRVIATCRTPDNATELKAFAATHPAVTVEKLDVADNAAIDALSAKLRGQPIDALINNAGITGELGARASAALDPEEFQRVLRVNTYAPLRLARALMPNIAASGQKKIISVSSAIGSLTLSPQYMQYAPAYHYAISKAGLNMAMRMLATEVKPRGVLVGLVTPGMVDTAMQTQYRSASAAEGTPITAPGLTPAQSAHGVVDYIIGLNAEKAGRCSTMRVRNCPGSCRCSELSSCRDAAVAWPSEKCGVTSRHVPVDFGAHHRLNSAALVHASIGYRCDRAFARGREFFTVPHWRVVSRIAYYDWPTANQFNDGGYESCHTSMRVVAITSTPILIATRSTITPVTAPYAKA